MFRKLIILLVYILNFINSLPTTSQHYARFGHTSALVDKKLYFMFGVISASGQDQESSRDLFYLDVSQPFANNLPLVDIQSSIPTNVAWSTASAGGSNKTTIFSFGGWFRNLASAQPDTSFLVFTFQTPNGPWEKSSLIGGTPPITATYSGIKSVIDGNGKMYLFGGDNSTITYGSMFILDTINLLWTNGSNAPFNRTSTASILLKNGEILYIGGGHIGGNSTGADINTILVYNTNSSVWSTTKVNGPYIDPRFGHTAVLAPDGKIIIYGGVFSFVVMAKPALVWLDTNVSPYSWTIPNIPSDNSPPPLTAHTADLVENYMIIAFGTTTPFFNDTSKISNEIYLLDTHTYTWTTTFGQSSSNSTTVTNSPSTSPNNTRSIGIGIGVTVAIIISLSIVGFFVRRYYYKKRKFENIYPTAGDTR